MNDPKTWNDLAAEVVRLMGERDELATALKSVVAGGAYCDYCVNGKTCGCEIVLCKRFKWRGAL